jgi:hypothetical protein
MNTRCQVPSSIRHGLLTLAVPVPTGIEEEATRLVVQVVTSS